MACLCGAIFAIAVFLTPLLGSYLYPKVLEWFDPTGKCFGHVSRWMLVGLLWITPGLVAFTLFRVILALSRSVLSLPEAPLPMRAIAWGMGAGLIAGIAIWRYFGRRENLR